MIGPSIQRTIGPSVYSFIDGSMTRWLDGHIMLAHGHRLERLADQIRTEVAEMIAGELKDPRIGFATVTHVDLSSDLRHGRVLVSVPGDEESQRETLEGLSSAAGYVRYQISHRLRLRRAPELVFVLDRGAEEGQRIETLLQKLKDEH